MIHDTSLVRRAPGLITAEVETESVVLNSATGTFYQLNVSAARVWAAIDTPSTFGGLIAALVAAHEVTVEQCRADLDALIESMRERGLVEIG